MILSVPPSPRLAPGATDALADGEGLLAAGVVQAVATSKALATATSGPRHPLVRCSGAAPIQSSFYWYGQVARPRRYGHINYSRRPGKAQIGPSRGSAGPRGAAVLRAGVSGCTEW